MMRFVTALSLILFFAAIAGAQSGTPSGAYGPGGNGSGGGVGNGAGPVLAVYPMPQCPTSDPDAVCIQTPADTKRDLTCSGSTTTIACTDNPFTSTAVDGGKQIGWWQSCQTDVAGTTAGTAPGAAVTIISVIDSNHAVVSGAPSNSMTNPSCLVYGHSDDAAFTIIDNLMAAAGAACTKVMLGAVDYLWTIPHLYNQPLGCKSLPGLVNNSTTFGNLVLPNGIDVEGRCVGCTVVHLASNFPNGDAGNHGSAGDGQTGYFSVPLGGSWTNFQLSGDGQNTGCNVPAGKNLIVANLAKFTDVTLTNLCNTSNQNTVGLAADFGVVLTRFNNSGFGDIGLSTVGTSGLFNQGFIVSVENNNTSSLKINNTAPAGQWNWQFFGSYFLGGVVQNAGGANVIVIPAGAVVKLYGTEVSNCPISAGCQNISVALIQNKGTLYANGLQMTVQGGSTNAGGLSNAASTSVAYLQNTVLARGSGSVTYGDVAGAKLVDLGGNTFGTTASINGQVVGSASITGTALVTGNIGLTSGWGTSSVASVTAGSDSHAGSFTITGAAGSANPTLTLTFPTPYLVAPASCTLSFGSSGATTDFSNVFASPPTTTSVVFNLIGTPTAVSIVFDYRCGP